MSSMVIHTRFKALCAAAVTSLAFVLPACAHAQAGTPVVQQLSGMESAISKWELLQKDRELGFYEYSGFALAYPEFPRMEIIRIRAENALADVAPAQRDILRFFDAHPPLTNGGKARYAVALAGARRPEAFEMARAAWRGGQMAEASEATLLSLYSSRFEDVDHLARMDALLWQRDQAAAVRHMINLAPADRDLAMARLSLVGGSMPEDAGLRVPSGAFSDAGFVYNLVSHLRSSGQTGEAVSILSNRSEFAQPALDPEKMVGEMLAVAKKSSALDAWEITSRIDDLFEPGTDISEGSFRLRDEYTDLMWLGGTKALWELGRGDRAAPLFERYGMAARGSLTKAKGFFWAGRAAAQAGDQDAAKRYFERAAQWPEYYYGQLAISALQRPMPIFEELPAVQVSADKRREFESRPLIRALVTMADNRRAWQTERRFFEAIGESVADETEMMMAHQLAERLRLPEMSVVLGFKASERGFKGLERIGFPIAETPVVTDWAMTHAVTRQESEFDRTRISHANARGMMQLLRSTAREQAGKMGVPYNASWLIERPQYNIQLGDGYFTRQLNRYGGAYPLAAAAYNAGGGRVNQWLALNGDPRRGDIDWVTWIERIPARFETRYYVMRVIGNAVTYSHMYPEQAGIPRDVQAFLP